MDAGPRYRRLNAGLPPAAGLYTPLCAAIDGFHAGHRTGTALPVPAKASRADPRSRLRLYGLLRRLIGNCRAPESNGFAPPGIHPSSLRSAPLTTAAPPS